MSTSNLYFHNIVLRILSDCDDVSDLLVRERECIAYMKMICADRHAVNDTISSSVDSFIQSRFMGKKNYMTVDDYKS